MNGTLDDLYNLLSDPNRWIKRHFCLYEDGTWCSEIKKGYKFCLFGAVCYLDLSKLDRDKLHLVIQTKYSYPDMTSFNDNTETTHEMVLETIDEARRMK